jgi:hypothetical protein
MQGALAWRTAQAGRGRAGAELTSFVTKALPRMMRGSPSLMITFACTRTAVDLLAGRCTRLPPSLPLNACMVGQMDQRREAQRNWRGART